MLFHSASISQDKFLSYFDQLPRRKLPDDILPDIQNDTAILIRYDSYGYIHSHNKGNLLCEAELRGTHPGEIRYFSHF